MKHRGLQDSTLLRIAGGLILSGPVMVVCCKHGMSALGRAVGKALSNGLVWLLCFESCPGTRGYSLRVCCLFFVRGLKLCCILPGALICKHLGLHAASSCLWFVCIPPSRFALQTPSMHAPPSVTCPMGRFDASSCGCSFCLVYFWVFTESSGMLYSKPEKAVGTSGRAADLNSCSHLIVG
jgi:hypothetical protein